MVRTRNNKARNERIETGVLVNGHKGKNLSVERRVENAIVGKQLDSVQEETLAVTATEDVVDKAQSSSPAPKTQTQIDGGKPSKGFGPRGGSLSGRKGQKACKVFLQGTCANSSCYYWHPPVCQNYKSVVGAHSATNVCLDTQRLMGSSVKSRRKVVGKDQLPY